MAAENESEGGQATDEAAHSRQVALLQEGLDAYNRGDLGWVYEHSAEDIEVRTAAGLVNSGSFRGRGRFRTWMEEWQEAWSAMTIVIRNVEVFDDEILLVEVVQTGIGSISGIATKMEMVQVLQITGGEIARFHLYPHRELALAAVERMRAAE